MSKKIKIDEIITYIEENMKKEYVATNCGGVDPNKVLGKYAFVKPYLTRVNREFFSGYRVRSENLDINYDESVFDAAIRRLLTMLDEDHEVCVLKVAKDFYDRADVEASPEYFETNPAIKVAVIKNKNVHLEGCVCGSRTHYDYKNDKIIKVDKVYDITKLTVKTYEDLIFIPIWIDETLRYKYPSDYEDVWTDFRIEDIAWALQSEENDSQAIYLRWVWSILAESFKKSVQEIKLVVKSQIANVDKRINDLLMETIEKGSALKAERNDYEDVDEKIDNIEF